MKFTVVCFNKIDVKGQESKVRASRRLLQRWGNALFARQALILAMVGFAVAVLISPGDPGYDTAWRLQVTHWMWRGEPQADLSRALDCTAQPGGVCDYVTGADGNLYLPTTIGQPLAMLPADIVAHALTDSAGVTAAIREKMHLGVVTLLTFPVIAALALAYSYRLLREIGFRGPVAGCATLALLLTTTFLVYTHVNQENSLIYLLVCGGLYHCIAFSRSGSPTQLFLAGLLAGSLLLVRLTEIACLLPIAGLVMWMIVRSPDRVAGGLAQAGSRRADWSTAVRMAALFALPVVAAVFVERGYQWYRFGSWSGTYADIYFEHYAKARGLPVGYPFGHDRIRGVLGPILFPEKSIFVFNPTLIPLVVYLTTRWKTLDVLFRAVVVAVTACFLLLLAGYSGTYMWAGDGAWGPRHHLVPVELLLLLGTAALLAAMPNLGIIHRIVVLGFALASLAIQLSSLPKMYNVEVAQLEAGMSPRIVPLLRAQNLWAIASGTFERDNRHAGQDTILRMATRETANTLLAFRIGPYVGPRIQMLAVGLWTLMAVAAVGVIALLSAAWGKEIHGPAS